MRNHFGSWPKEACFNIRRSRKPPRREDRISQAWMVGETDESV